MTEDGSTMGIAEFIGRHIQQMIAHEYDRALADYSEAAVCHVAANRDLRSIEPGPATAGISFLEHFRGPTAIRASFDLVYGWTEREVGTPTRDRLRTDLKVDDRAGQATMTVEVLGGAGEVMLAVSEWWIVGDGLITDQGTNLVDLRR